AEGGRVDQRRPVAPGPAGKGAAGILVDVLALARRRGQECQLLAAGRGRAGPGGLLETLVGGLADGFGIGEAGRAVVAVVSDAGSLVDLAISGRTDVERELVLERQQAEDVDVRGGLAEGVAGG